MPVVNVAHREPAWITPSPTSTPAPIILTIERSTTTYITTIFRLSATLIAIAGTSTESQSSGPSPGVLVGAVLGSLLGFMVLLLFCCYYRYQDRPDSYRYSPSISSTYSPPAHSPPRIKLESNQNLVQAARVQGKISLVKKKAKKARSSGRLQPYTEDQAGVKASKISVKRMAANYDTDIVIRYCA
ncbi:uncharacterized protein BDZ99DRAFT_121991 [Mytilinidion resinicola]|uniref:Uncharacterized protein n=1 Tax=Mytilinidion resinicola TaxID=574789 RepID=A0A6A6Z4V2_9PEZI|nr:uncharacterized protein BDZ99DRAFT_121991 [Mytilinidion resinicola]KAF2815769.1 hypothetical protein BDZ99DRAFT_121991 [Mytilinidion resinicola]